MQSDRRWMVVAGALCAFAFLVLQADLATQKSFTEDEAFQHVVTCPESYASILIHGGLSQCSPPPLYYLLQKTYLKAVPFNEWALVSFRGLSLVSGFFVTLVLFVTIAGRLGWFAAFFSMLLLESQPIFHQFSAESRPYAFWLLLFTLWLVVLRENRWWTQVAVAAGLTGVSAAGLLQALGGWAGELLVRLRQQRVPNMTRLATWLHLAPGILLVGIGLYYSLRSCPPVEGGWNLLETRNPDLVLFVWRLLFPSGPIYYTWLINGVVALGLGVSTFRVLKRNSRSWEDLMGFQLAVQLGVTLLIALAVAWKGYFFVPRMFIFLVVVRAFLGAIGIRILWSSVQGIRIKKWASGLGSVALIGIMVFKLVQLRGFLIANNESETVVRVSARVLCDELRMARAVWVRKDLSAGEAANTWVAAVQASGKCEGPRIGSAYLLLNGPRFPGREYEVTLDSAMSGFEPYQVNGVEVHLTR